jgi:hypothetical protein
LTALALGARSAAARLARVGSGVAFAVAIASVALVAFVERRALPLAAADRALTGVALGVVLPLLGYGTVARALDGRRLDQALASLARHGGNRRQAALGVVLVVTPLLAIAGALLAALAVIVTRAPADPLLLSDLRTSSWVGALAGTAYAAWFVLGSTVGRAGGGRIWALVADWVLGAGATAAALPWPRAHVRNLLGAAPVLGMPEWSASLALGALTVIYVALALWREPA